MARSAEKGVWFFLTFSLGSLETTRLSLVRDACPLDADVVPGSQTQRTESHPRGW